MAPPCGRECTPSTFARMKRLVPLMLVACSTNSTPVMMSMPDMGLCASATGVRPAARKDIDLVGTGSSLMVFYGGDQAPFDPMAAVQAKQFVDELWGFDTTCGSWHALMATGTTPGPRAAYAAVWDEGQRVLLIAGRAGATATPPLTNEVWALDGPSLTWRQ